MISSVHSILGSDIMPITHSSSSSSSPSPSSAALLKNHHGYYTSTTDDDDRLRVDMLKKMLNGCDDGGDLLLGLNQKIQQQHEQQNAETIQVKSTTESSSPSPHSPPPPQFSSPRKARGVAIYATIDSDGDDDVIDRIGDITGYDDEHSDIADSEHDDEYDIRMGKKSCLDLYEEWKKTRQLEQEERHQRHSLSQTLAASATNDILMDGNDHGTCPSASTSTSILSSSLPVPSSSSLFLSSTVKVERVEGRPVRSRSRSSSIDFCPKPPQVHEVERYADDETIRRDCFWNDAELNLMKCEARMINAGIDPDDFDWKSFR